MDLFIGDGESPVVHSLYSLSARSGAGCVVALLMRDRVLTAYRSIGITGEFSDHGDLSYGHGRRKCIPLG
jgi:hypothetical protein